MTKEELEHLIELGKKRALSPLEIIEIVAEHIIDRKVGEEAQQLEEELMKILESKL